MKALALHSIHQRLGATFGELAGKELVATYGDVDAEYRAAREGCALLDLGFREMLCVTGEDRVSFLQGMVSNDIARLPVGGSLYATMLTPKGALVADARIFRRSEDVLLDLEPGAGQRAMDFLQRHLVSEEAELHSLDWGVLSLLGPRASDIAGAALPSSDELLRTSCLLPSLPGVDLLGPREKLVPVAHALLAAPGVTPAGFDAFERVRVEEGVPRYGQELDEDTIPLEANLERAISYDKGCYVGQEVIARATFRGQVNRRLVGLFLGASPPSACAELFAQEKKVGSVRSVVWSPALGGHVALAYVHRQHAEVGTRLLVHPDGGEATVLALPMRP
ncbi:MAG: YgfZ/GcvT domain-containing protein [Myxococcota bacterium]